MRRIVISDAAGNTVVLLSDLEFEITPEFVGETAVMASGREIRDYAGIKTNLRIPTGWLSPENLALLCRMIAQGQVLRIDYPDVDGDRRGEFWVDLPVRRAFSYGRDGVSQWYGVEINARSYAASPAGEAVVPQPVISADVVDGGFVISSRAFSAGTSGGGFVIR